MIQNKLNFLLLQSQKLIVNTLCPYLALDLTSFFSFEGSSPCCVWAKFRTLRLILARRGCQPLTTRNILLVET